jgi:hypothetical protein
MDFQFHLTHLHIKTETRKIVYWCIIMSKTDLGNEMNMQQDLYVVYMHTKKTNNAKPSHDKNQIKNKQMKFTNELKMKSMHSETWTNEVVIFGTSAEIKNS